MFVCQLKFKANGRKETISQYGLLYGDRLAGKGSESRKGKKERLLASIINLKGEYRLHSI